MTNAEIFTAAWVLAKQGAKRFGGSSKDFFACSLKITYTNKGENKMTGLNGYRKVIRDSKDFNEDTALTLDRSELQNQIIETVVPMFFRSEKKISTWTRNMKCTMIISKDFPTAEKAQVLVDKINAVNDEKLFRPASARKGNKGKIVVSFGFSKLRLFY
ncbi:hypothetical protein [Loigolactobacillus jiayinensis]|uniref:Uncharacterized protein n=1 Tax=Loigolactobacillus jiayinensis TaxID=2486016 RepID=A0ABW1RCF2_9LACO|nr:hypothetical protein [Loigolactobacillus jiayinensis]